jgi:glycosyltransferase involved in cell wall biosynthesis
MRYSCCCCCCCSTYSQHAHACISAAGSHALFLETVKTLLHPNTTLQTYSFPAKKWHWRVRTSALALSESIPPVENVQTLVATSMLNLAELLGVRADLARIPHKVLYVHENQLVYPVHTDKGERDHVFGHALVVSCLAADSVVWNSSFNLESFVAAIPSFFSKIPLESAGRPKPAGVQARILAKSKVRYPALFLPARVVTREAAARPGALKIAYPHRWEHDKNPQAFVHVLGQLAEADLDFAVFVFGGESYEGTNAREELSARIGSARIAHTGRVESREEYLRVLANCDVAVSTANHEFFGIAMVEAARLGVACLVPDRLAYVELFTSDARYRTDGELSRRLEAWARDPNLVRSMSPASSLQPHAWAAMDATEPSVVSHLLEALCLCPDNAG